MAQVAFQVDPKPKFEHEADPFHLRKTHQFIVSQTTIILQASVVDVVVPQSNAPNVDSPAHAVHTLTEFN